MFEQLVIDDERILGPDALEALISRHVLNKWRGLTGDLSRAITEASQLVDDRIGILGADAPDTWPLTSTSPFGSLSPAREMRLFVSSSQHSPTRPRVGGEPPTPSGHEACWLARLFESGAFETAIDHLEQLLVDQTRALGPDDRAVLGTRQKLAAVTIESGSITDAVIVLRQLVADQARILGPDSLEGLAPRNNLAFCLGESGAVDEAVEQLEQLLVDQSRILGPDAADTLTTLGNLSYWHGESGQIEQAILELKKLLAQRSRIDGRDSSRAESARDELLHWLLESDSVDQAIPELEQILDEQVSAPTAPGPSSPISSRRSALQVREVRRGDRSAPTVARRAEASPRF